MQPFRSFSKRNLCQLSSFALTGHDRPDDVVGDHQHSFYLPLASDLNHPEILKEFHVWCPYGLTQAEVEAMISVQRLDWGSGKYPVRPVLTAISRVVPEGCPISTGQVAARIWRSITPFVPPRYFYRGNLHHAKLKVKDTPEQQLAQCLKQAGINTPGEIHRLTWVEQSRGLYLHRAIGTLFGSQKVRMIRWSME